MLRGSSDRMTILLEDPQIRTDDVPRLHYRNNLAAAIMPMLR
jgi:hypothetical protein